MGATKSLSEAIKKIGLMSGVGMIAIAFDCRRRVPYCGCQTPNQILSIKHRLWIIVAQKLDQESHTSLNFPIAEWRKADMSLVR